MKISPRRIRLFSVLLCGLLVGCDWVDSGGDRSSEAPAEPSTNVFLDDTPIGRAIVVDENSVARVTATRDSVDDSPQTFTWSETPSNEGALSICRAVDGFNSALAADTFAEACTSETACALEFEQIDGAGDEVAEFLMSVPELQASVGVRHTLTVVDEDGETNTTDYEFCLLAINDPPIARNDTFVVLEGETLDVSADGNNLLSNDSDDVDVSNEPLSVITPTDEPPELAESFELRSDGGFIYVPAETDGRSDVIDSFVYEISDGGLTRSAAMVTIRVVVSNLAPALVDTIPAQNAAVGQFFVLDLAAFFSDPEGNALSFSAQEQSLPQSGSIALTPAGVLSGTPDVMDVGEYEIAVSASDGSSVADAFVMLTIIDEMPSVETGGEPVYVDDTVFDQVITLGQNIQPVAPEFEEPDGDVLVYRSAGTTFPRGLILDLSTGVLSGRPQSRGLTRGMRIQATDPDGNTAISDRFTINVR